MYNLIICIALVFFMISLAIENDSDLEWFDSDDSDDFNLPESGDDF